MSLLPRKSESAVDKFKKIAPDVECTQVIWTQEEIIKNINSVSLHLICKHQNLSEEIMLQFSGKFKHYWDRLFLYQNLSKEFVINNIGILFPPHDISDFGYRDRHKHYFNFYTNYFSHQISNQKYIKRCDKCFIEHDQLLNISCEEQIMNTVLK